MRKWRKLRTSLTNLALLVGKSNKLSKQELQLVPKNSVKLEKPSRKYMNTMKS
jgi:hypothetical protein